MSALATLEPVDLKVAGESVAFVRDATGKVWANAPAIAPFLGFAFPSAVHTLARRNWAEVERETVRLTVSRTGSGLAAEGLFFSLRGVLLLLLLANTAKAKTTRSAVVDAILRAVDQKRGDGEIIAETKGALLGCHGKVRELQAGARRRDVRDALEDVLAGIDEQTALLDVLRTGELRGSVPLFPPTRPDPEGTKPSERATTHAFARLMKSVDRRERALKGAASC